MSIYTDGSCLNGKYGGWSFCLIEDDEIWYCVGSEINTTNNRMELVAVIESLTFLPDKTKTYTIHTDSKLTMNCAMNIWKRKCNLDLWGKYDILSHNLDIKWKWIKAHNGNWYNEKVDRLAREEAKMVKK